MTGASRARPGDRPCIPYGEEEEEEFIRIQRIL